ncbi:MAG: glucose-1-phosphate cytidylyltransferase [Clostridiales bacterium]|jgi:glucose-1-phosphate cytidylyltransferase|nr:glucose-1-phosphate cytidylyltransferase [Clostridiales bacterium]
MKTLILAGGYGTRISEESHLKPKPMLEIGGQPILWHIMKRYSAYGYNDFIILAGYKQHVIKEYFADYYLHRADITFDFAADNKLIVHTAASEPWKVTVVDTGLETLTGGRVKRAQKYVGDEAFMLTYGDGVADIDLNKLLEFHKTHGKTATLTAVGVTQRFGVIEISNSGVVTDFREKGAADGSVINGGFFVFNSGIFDLLEGDDTILERKIFETLAQRNELFAYKHDGFWQCMDTKRDKDFLERLWDEGNAPWAVKDGERIF